MSALSWSLLSCSFVLFSRSSMSSSRVFLCVGVCVCVQFLMLLLCLHYLSWQGSVWLRDLAVCDRTMLLHYPALRLICSHQGFSLPPGVLTPAWKESGAGPQSVVLFLLVTQQSMSGLWSVSSPLSEVFKEQFVVMAEQLWVIRNVGGRDLQHPEEAHVRGRNCYNSAQECLSPLLTLTQTYDPI